jgi:hypothetical protein
MNWTPIIISALIPLLSIIVLYSIPVIIDWFFKTYGDHLTNIKKLADAHDATVQGIVTIVQQEANGAIASAKFQAALVKCTNDLTLAGIPVPELTELITKAVALCKLTWAANWEALGGAPTTKMPVVATIPVPYSIEPTVAPDGAVTYHPLT